jgi:hypothetical protein
MGKRLWGLARTPFDLRREDRLAAETTPNGLEGDPYFRSTEQLIGYEIRAADGRVGHLEGFIMDDDAWTLPYLVVDTRNWLPGRKVLISRHWVNRFDWVETSAEVSLTTEQIEESPE